MTDYFFVDFVKISKNSDILLGSVDLFYFYIRLYCLKRIIWIFWFSYFKSSTFENSLLKPCDFVSPNFVDKLLDYFTSFFIPTLNHYLLRLSFLHKILKFLLLFYYYLNWFDLLFLSFRLSWDFLFVCIFVSNFRFLFCLHVHNQRFKHGIWPVNSFDLLFCQFFSFVFWYSFPSLHIIGLLYFLLRLCFNFFLFWLFDCWFRCPYVTLLPYILWFIITVNDLTYLSFCLSIHLFSFISFWLKQIFCLISDLLLFSSFID